MSDVGGGERPQLALVVDDDPTMRLLERVALEGIGLAVEEAGDGESASRRFAALAPDIVLLDVLLPGCDGFAVLERIRGLPGGEFVPVLMVTALDDTASIQHAYAAGATGFVVKPINWELLGHHVRYVLRASAAITEHRRAEERIVRLAYYDHLTDLPNRMLFHDRLGQALGRAQRSRSLIGVLFLDLDQFKLINDTLGHSVGDELLMAVAGRLVRLLRRTDSISRVEEPDADVTLARLGGDEFIVLVEGIHAAEDVATVATRILELFSRPFPVAAREIFVTASIGIAVSPHDGESAEELIKNADAAMYSAKDQGRNTFRFFDRSMNERAQERLLLENQLRRALEHRELELHYQPQLDLRTNRVTGAEALLRWRHPERGLVPPLEFIPMAEETGLIMSIGEWVLRTACAQAAAWEAAGLAGLRIAINLSRCQLRERGLPGLVARVIRETGVTPGQVQLEITESAVMRDPDLAVSIMRQVKELGVQLAIDDFGTGYSSLSHLKRFPIDALKIDRSFIRDIPQDRDSMAIARAIAAMAGSLELKVIAEGIETERQLAFVREHGCDEAQGYLFSRPVPREVFAAFFARHAAGAAADR